jgi:hypothetical protein
MYGILYISIILIVGTFAYKPNLLNDPVNIAIASTIVSYGLLNLLAVYLILKKRKSGKVLMHIVALLPVVLFPIGTIHAIKMLRALYSESASKYFDLAENTIDLIDTLS